MRIGVSNRNVSCRTGRSCDEIPTANPALLRTRLPPTGSGNGEGDKPITILWNKFSVSF